MPIRYAPFATRLGFAGLAFSPALAVVGVELPHTTLEALRARLASRYDEGLEVELPTTLAPLVRALTSALDGKGIELPNIAVDLGQATVFTREVYAATRAIPAGTTRTYGQVAKAIGRPKAARAVGAALARNPLPLLIPCHRVVGHDGQLVGFTAPGGTGLKARLLALESPAS